MYISYLHPFNNSPISDKRFFFLFNFHFPSPLCGITFFNIILYLLIYMAYIYGVFFYFYLLINCNLKNISIFPCILAVVLRVYIKILIYFIWSRIFICPSNSYTHTPTHKDIKPIFYHAKVYILSYHPLGIHEGKSVRFTSFFLFISTNFHICVHFVPGTSI